MRIFWWSVYQMTLLWCLIAQHIWCLIAKHSWWLFNKCMELSETQREKDTEGCLMSLASWPILAPVTSLHYKCTEFISREHKMAKATRVFWYRHRTARWGTAECSLVFSVETTFDLRDVNAMLSAMILLFIYLLKAGLASFTDTIYNKCSVIYLNVYFRVVLLKQSLEASVNIMCFSITSTGVTSV